MKTYTMKTYTRNQLLQAGLAKLQILDEEEWNWFYGTLLDGTISEIGEGQFGFESNNLDSDLMEQHVNNESRDHHYLGIDGVDGNKYPKALFPWSEEDSQCLRDCIAKAYKSDNPDLVTFVPSSSEDVPAAA